MIAELLDAYPGLTVEGIGRLTVYALRECYFHARDRDGQVLRVPPAGPESPEEEYREVLRLSPLPGWRCAEKLAGYRRRVCEEEAQEPAGDFAGLAEIARGREKGVAAWPTT